MNFKKKKKTIFHNEAWIVFNKLPTRLCKVVFNLNATKYI